MMKGITKISSLILLLVSLFLTQTYIAYQ